ncbi:GNAT family N-acetyltransferase [Pararhizobium sp. O133]|uniref:GNAT family N-acetyltransferase n=1 Tax=Pararhizobium sp. O133 TaxID=3449278 RepID=UPI003F682524
MTSFTFRNARLEDLDGVLSVQAVVFPAFQEGRATFSERLQLYPDGFFVVEEDSLIKGYLVSYPFQRLNPPPLDTLIGSVSPDSDAYYVHDLSLLPEMRGRGAAVAMVEAMTSVARRANFATMGLIAVGGADIFWRRFGFAPVFAEALEPRLRAYGAEAVYMERPL